MSVVDEDLLVQEDNKRHKERKVPEPQLVAQVIAAFQTINTRQTRVLGQGPGERLRKGNFLLHQRSCIPIFQRYFAPLAV